jgi:uncharacterized protein with PIN domain
MNRATLRAYADLNDHLPPEHRQASFSHAFAGHPSVKDVIESLGIPHVEIDWIVIDGSPVDFSRQVQDGDRIAVYPRMNHLDMPYELHLLPRRPNPIRFVLDGHLGQLARYLRMLGFDSWYQHDTVDSKLAHVSAEMDRILLTRDRELLKRNEVRLGAFVRASEPRQQLIEEVVRWDLVQAVEPFSRCIPCNGRLETVELDRVRAQVPADMHQQGRPFRLCQSCGHVYWHGSHVDRMQMWIERVLADVGQSQSAGADRRRT